MFFACQSQLIASILQVDCKTFGRQKAEPLQCLLVESCVCKSVLPLRYAQVHNHEAEVVSKGVCYEEPVARKVLKPNLGFALTFAIHVNQCESATLEFAVDFESKDLLINLVTVRVTFVEFA